MIIDSKGMKEIESASGFTPYELMEKAGALIAEEIRKESTEDTSILFLAGKGNNGGDAFVACRLLNDRKCRVICIDGEPKSEEAKKAYSLLPDSRIGKVSRIRSAVKSADLIVDGVYGFSYHGELKPDIRKILETVSSSGAKIISIDINSGAEADTGFADKGAVISDITLALDCYKPFHLMKKEHRLFRECRLLSLGIPHPDKSRFCEMDEELFFRSFPKKQENAYKGTYGKTLLIGGSWGTAGALSLNIIGAKTTGASYIEVGLPESIYPIVASQHITPVFHPFGHETMSYVIEPLLKNAKSVAFGSGAVYFDKKEDCLDLILQESRCPVVLDAEALRLLVHNTYLLRFVKIPVIITPHIGEFAALINQPQEAVLDRKLEYAETFAREYNVTVVLKGPNTIVVSPAGEVYINQTGNPALAQAGSGDLLAGIMAGILSQTRDIFTAVCMAVWLHGKIADIGLKNHSVRNFPLEEYPAVMDALFRKHGF